MFGWLVSCELGFKASDAGIGFNEVRLLTVRHNELLEAGTVVSPVHNSHFIFLSLFEYCRVWRSRRRDDSLNPQVGTL